MTERPPSAYQGDEPYVFVSYSHQDRERVYAEILWLQSQGFNVWFDEGIEAGHEWHQDLADRISGCSLFLYFITPSSVQSSHCLREVHYAVEHGQQLLAVHLEETDLPSGLRLSLGSVQAILRHELSPADYRIKLIRVVGKFAERGVGVTQEGSARPTGVSWSLAGAAVAGALLMGAIGAGLLLPVDRAPPSAGGMSKHLELQIAGLRRHPPMISRDGRRFFDYDGLVRTRLISEHAWSPIPGTQEATFTMPSPSAESIAFCSSSAIYTIALSGGTPRRVVNGGFCGLAWVDDQVLLYSSDQTSGILEAPILGGTPKRLTTAEAGTVELVDAVLPARQGILLTTFGNARTNPRIGVTSMDGGEVRELIPGLQAFYAPTGHLLFFRENSLWAAGFDSRNWQIQSTPVAVLSNVGDDGLYGNWSLSGDGTLIYLPDEGPPTFNLVWVDRQGREEILPSRPMAFRNPEISPSGDLIAVTVGPLNQGEIWIYSLSRNILSRLTFDGGWQPTWADDEHVVFGQIQGTQGNSIVSKRADGRGAVQLLGRADGDAWYANFSASGDLVGTVGNDLAVLPRNDEEQFQILLTTPASEIQPRLSDDGRWLAYASNESGRYEVYVRPFPDVAAGKWQVSEAGGGSPVWSRDGTELFYLTLDGRMIAVSIDPDSAGFAVLGSSVLFDASAYPAWAALDGSLLPEFDVSPDSSHFLMIKASQSADKTAYVIVDWFEELQRRAPL